MNRKLFLRLALGTGGFLGIAVVALLATVQLRWDRVFDVAAPAFAASADPEVIARGEYLAYGPAHCSYCHTPLEDWPALDAGESLPLRGGFTWVFPPGTVHSPNLTPDAETGIGRYSDAQLARMIRHNIRPDGRLAFPMMAFQGLSDEDLVAVISYLRAQPPVRNQVPDRRFSFIGKAIMAFVLKPPAVDGPPATSPPADGSVERGAYLANAVAGCGGCHTERSLMDGSAIGPEWAGGMRMPDDHDPKIEWVTPNLTPHATTGHIASWTEEQFLARFRVGSGPEGTHMPWAAFARMSDDDIRAIYRYLRTVEPVERVTGPFRQAKG